MLNINPNMKRRQRAINKKFRRRRIICMLVLIILCAIVSVMILNKDEADKKKEFSKDVLKYKPMVEKYAEEYNISQYTEYLLAIIQIESAGRKEDVMQSSESLDLKPNTLNSEDSIKQGCKYFSELLKLADEKGCDIKSVIQSYNYGKGFLDYIDQEGDKYSLTLAENFAEKYSKKEKVDYKNPVAIKINGGWRYNYGNMFYVELIGQYVNFN